VDRWKLRGGGEGLKGGYEISRRGVLGLAKLGFRKWNILGGEGRELSDGSGVCMGEVGIGKWWWVGCTIGGFQRIEIDFWC
jgi:hypothetical protein